MFDVLVYTDCSETESVNGRTGFQFTTLSPGATPTDEDFVKRRMLHAVPIGLAAEDWRDHPSTCAYAVEGGRFYLSRGASTGATLSGRPGNQLTTTIVSSDTGSVLPMRPAQLMSATDWASGRPPAREVGAWPTPLQISSDFEVDALHRLVVEDSWAREAFPAILTMVEQTRAEPRVRLILRSSDQTLVLRWIALVSMFIDADVALGLEFRVFAENPVATSADIVGAHPLMSPSLTVAQAASSGVNLVDLESREHSRVTPSEAAARHARWFLGGDPYQALDAVEVSTRWATTLPPELAVRAAELATLGTGAGVVTTEVFDIALTALRGLAVGGRVDELDAYGDALADLVTSYAPSGPDALLRVVETMWQLHGAGDAELSQGLTLAALEWAARSRTDAAAWARAHDASRPARLAWPDDEARGRASGLVATILDDAASADLPEAFALAEALGTGIPADRVSGAAIRLATRWAGDPRLGVAVESWLHGEVVERELRVQLADAIAHEDDAAIAALRAGSWDRMLRRPWAHDPSDPMSIWLAARALALDPRDRARILEVCAQHARDRTWPLFLEHADGLDPDEVALWVRAHGTLDPGLGTRVERHLAAAASSPVWVQRGGPLLEDLASQQLPPTAGVRALLGDHHSILKLFVQAERAHASVPNRSLLALAAGRPHLSAIYAALLGHLLIHLTDIETLSGIARGAAVEAAFATELDARLRAADPAALAGALRLLGSGSKVWAPAAKKSLDRVWDDAGATRARETLAGLVDAKTAAALVDYEKDQGKGRISRGVLRAAQTMFKGRED